MVACLCTRTPYSLNAISHDSAVGMIKAVLAQGVNVEEVGVCVVVWAKLVMCVLQPRQSPGLAAFSMSMHVHKQSPPSHTP